MTDAQAGLEGEGGEMASAAGVNEPLHPRPATPVPEEVTKKGPSELTRRIFTAVILIPTVIYVIWHGGWLYLAVVALFSLIAQREFYGLIEDKGAQPFVALGLGFGVAVNLVAYLGTEYHATLLLTASLLVMMVAQLQKRQITEALANISGTFFGVFYVAWLLSHAVVLRFFDNTLSLKYRFAGGDVASLGIAPDCGIFFMIFVLAVVVACDAGAYFAGRAWGRRKLAPTISPNKSVEGALGGVLAGTLFGLLTKLLFDLQWPALSQAFPWYLAVAFGLVLSVVGIVGDLVESLLKRDADVKDAGALLPGMGGVLDRIDAPLLAIPVMYYMLLGWVFWQLR
jgi:phosphatidate cytidylyltransferase